MVIVVAIEDPERDSEILERAAELAGVLDEALHIVHVMTQSRFVELETTSVDETGKPIDMDRIRQEATSVSIKAAEEIGLAEYEPIGSVGDPSKEIVRHASNIDSSYIVIGGRNRSPVGKAVFGSVTQTILLTADCPVIVVKRSG